MKKIKSLLKELPGVMKVLILACFTAAIIFIGFSLGSCSSYPDDNFVEEMTEEYIQQKTGVSLDFTGDSPED